MLSNRPGSYFLPINGINEPLPLLRMSTGNKQRISLTSAQLEEDIETYLKNYKFEEIHEIEQFIEQVEKNKLSKS